MVNFEDILAGTGITEKLAGGPPTSISAGAKLMQPIEDIAVDKDVMRGVVESLEKATANSRGGGKGR